MKSSPRVNITTLQKNDGQPSVSMKRDMGGDGEVAATRGMKWLCVAIWLVCVQQGGAITDFNR